MGGESSINGSGEEHMKKQGKKTSDRKGPVGNKDAGGWNILRWILERWMGWYGLVWSSAEYGPVKDSCE
jgi:hypothetical protein